MRAARDRGTQRVERVALLDDAANDPGGAWKGPRWSSRRQPQATTRAPRGDDSVCRVAGSRHGAATVLARIAVVISPIADANSAHPKQSCRWLARRACSSRESSPSGANAANCRASPQPTAAPAIVDIEGSQRVSGCDGDGGGHSRWWMLRLGARQPGAAQQPGRA